ncbi:hypothetical protein MMSP_1316 [Mycobacterium sp. 012931]|nr:hypothetical protein MMSP_1316 [Mycobacterium sp. 012931]
MDVVDVIAVGNGDVAAAIAVSVIVPVMHAVAVAGFTFVKVIAVAPVQMTVVQIVDVITMRNRDMSATVAMRMVVPRVLPVRYRVNLFLLVIVERAGNVDMSGASADLSVAVELSTPPFNPQPAITGDKSRKSPKTLGSSVFEPTDIARRQPASNKGARFRRGFGWAKIPQLSNTAITYVANRTIPLARCPTRIATSATGAPRFTLSSRHLSWSAPLFSPPPPHTRQR